MNWPLVERRDASARCACAIIRIWKCGRKSKRPPDSRRQIRPSLSAGWSSGIDTVNSLPRSLPALSAVTLPSCSSTIFRTSARPIPRPPCGVLAAGILLHEKLEHARQCLRRNADAVVANREHGLIAGRVEAHRDLTAIGCVFGGVDEQVREYLLHSQGVDIDRNRLPLAFRPSAYVRVWRSLGRAFSMAPLTMAAASTRRRSRRILPRAIRETSSRS